nr:reverse transcriptase domain-containing protein [Tanacetum cinerariifolium]
MPPKRMSTSEASSMTQAAIRKFVADSVTVDLEAQAATMANTSNPNRNTGPTGTPVAKMGNYKEFICCTLTGDAMSWWNTYAQPMGVDQANKITKTELKRLMINKRLQELAVLCPNMVPNTEKHLEAFIRGLPRSIEGNVTASKPQTLEEAINIAQRLMDQKPDEKRIKDIPVVKEFPDIFPKDLAGHPPIRQVEFQIDLIPGAAPVAHAPCRLAPSEM